MTIGHIITTQKELLEKCQKSTDCSPCKSNIIDINQQYADYINQGGHATPYERRQVKNNMYRLFQAMESADIEANATRLVFHGPPIAPDVPQREDLDTVSVQEYEPGKVHGKKGETVIIGPENARSHVYLEDLEQSTIYGCRKQAELPFSVHAQNLSGCQVGIYCDGPIILHGIENSTLIVKCHQLRIHNMENCRVFAEVNNDRVIIEQSKEVVFFGLLRGNLSSPSFVVDDFDWPNKELSNPHYTFRNEENEKESDFDDAKDLLRKWEREVQE